MFNIMVVWQELGHTLTCSPLTVGGRGQPSVDIRGIWIPSSPLKPINLRCNHTHCNLLKNMFFPKTIMWFCEYFLQSKFFFSVRLLSVLRGHSFFHPRHNGQWPPTSKDFLSQIYPLHLFSYLNSWERASIFPF